MTQLLISSDLLRKPPALGTRCHLLDGRIAVFDYNDGLEYWFTLSDGSTKGFLYSAGIQPWLNAMGCYHMETPL